ncbi:hypothetical protein BDN70DRAFT_990400 [Pholiota conissans]|uniref:NudC domain-containing protein 1 n=1 Tax=Pholiota conissans TaxID=109636 RepID=A0A9P6D4S4_9AGAR|nr:hypothetical protein BDN70DRAFT_990400 [Pholiota conissans]
MELFYPQKHLLNPKFEGYKLEAIPQDQAVSRYKLSRKPTQATSSGTTPLSFHEMRSRISHNHLTVDSETGNAVYVDEEYNVCLVGIPVSEGSQGPSFRVIYEMPLPMDASSALNIQREYPSAAFLNSSNVVVSDGNGLLYILPIKEAGDSSPIGMFTLRTEGISNAPFRLHHLQRLSPIAAVLLLSSRYYPADAKKPSNSNVEFDIWAVKINLLSLRPGSEMRDLEILWRRRGQDIPIYTTFIKEVNAYLLLSGSPYPDPNASMTKPYEPTPDEMAPIPRADENLDAKLIDKNDKPHPYSWTQTSDAVTVAFPLPSTTSKEKMKVLFTVQTLTLHVDVEPMTSENGTPVPIPHHSTTALWDSVNPTSCFWTWDRAAEHSYGLLTLHMEKKNEGTRWMHVFASSGTTPEHPEVPETLDPSELWQIRESLEKYTAALRSGEDASGLGLGHGVPSLAGGELDDEADAAVGRQAYLTWVEDSGADPIWYKTDSWNEDPVTVLAMPMPGTISESSDDLELVLKRDVDGVVYSLDPTSPSVWKHTSTYHALAFVLASKQDTRFTYHIPSRGVLALEGGSARDRGANVYLYRPPTKTQDKWSKQSVLQVDDGSGGALLGVGCVKLRGGKEGEIVVVCLTEGDLVLIRGI